MENYIQEGDYSNKIIQHFTTLIELYRSNPRYYIIRGCAYYRQGSLEEATLDFTRAIALESTQPLYYQNRAAVFFKLNQYEKATWDYTQVITLNNLDKEAGINRESAKVFLRRADALRLQGNLDAAIEDYEKANYIMMNLYSENEESNHDVYYDEVKEYICKKEYNKHLIDDYTELIRLDSRELDYYYIRGNLYYEQKNFRQAMKDYTRIIESDIKHSMLYDIYYKRALCCNKLHYYDQADQDLEIALTLLNNESINYSLRGCIYFTLEEYDKALADFKQALSINAKDVNAYRYLGMTYNQQENNEEAIKQFNKAIQYDGKFAEDYYYRARIYYTMKMFDKAIADYTRAIEIENDNLEYYIYRAKAYANLEKRKEAIADFTHVINNNYQCTNYYEAEDITTEDEIKIRETNTLLESYNNEKLAKIYFSRGYIYVELGMNDYAKEDFTKAIEICSHFIQPYYLRAYQIYEKEKEYDKAIDDYTKIIELKDSKDKTARILSLERRALLYKKLEQYQKAVEDFTELIMLNTENKNYYIMRADLHMKLEDYDGAIDDYSFIINEDNQCAGAYLARGDAYRKKNNLQAAISDYEKVKEIQSRNSR